MRLIFVLFASVEAGYILALVSNVMSIIDRLQRGESKAAEELLPLVYDELRKLAEHKMAGEKPGHTLQPTALVHEAWLRLGGDEAPHFQDRAHFIGAAAEAMRRILIDRARRRLAAKRGSGAEPVNLDELEIPSAASSDRKEAFHELSEAPPGFGSAPVLWRFGNGGEPTKSARGLAQSKTLPRDPKIHGPNVCGKNERALSMRDPVAKST